MDFKQQCEGYATYRWDDRGGIEVYGQGFPAYGPDSSEAKRIRTFWDKYGSIMSATARSQDVPLAWVVAIIAIESGGNEWACSPCIKEKDGVQICSFAPNCGGGVASNGQSYSCCAYGLMQIIDSNARMNGLKNGAELMGNPEDSIRIGTKIFRDALAGGAAGDPIVAARMYNGCKSCGNGRAPCGGGGLFGIGGQFDYTTKFAKSANTFLAMGLGPVASEKRAGFRPSTVTGIALLGIAAILGFGVWDTQRGQ